jgi:hypothetical protein
MDPYQHYKYYAKKKFLKLFGGEIRIYDEERTQLLFFVQQKAFKLKEDITVYTDESKTSELLKIQARKIIDFSAAYDVIDARRDMKVGALRRRGFHSLVRDKWEILDVNDNPIGEIIEDSALKAFIRRFLTNLIPQVFNIQIEQSTVGVLKQTFNPFVPQYGADFSMDEGRRLNRQMGIAAVVLLQVIEGRQG